MERDVGNLPEQSNPPPEGPEHPPPPQTYGSPSSLAAAATMPDPDPPVGVELLTQHCGFPVSLSRLCSKSMAVWVDEAHLDRAGAGAGAGVEATAGTAVGGVEAEAGAG